MKQAAHEYDKLTEKIHQHEALIIQLMSILAVTNRKVHELTNQINSS